jgi:pimeloyl-ACP methyl ester carboxylesterase
VDVVKTLLDELNIRNVTIIGHSFGGGVALALTEQLNRNNRGRVARLVLIASMAYPQQLPRFVELLRMPLISAVGISVIPAETQAYEALKESMLYPQRLSAADIKEYARALTDPDGRYAILKSAEQLVPDNFDQIIKLYRTVHQPSLLIWCRDDRVVPLWVGRKLAGDLPNSRLAIFPNCGHLVQEEVPEKAVLEIRRFLSTSR